MPPGRDTPLLIYFQMSQYNEASYQHLMRQHPQISQYLTSLNANPIVLIEYPRLTPMQMNTLDDVISRHDITVFHYNATINQNGFQKDEQTKSILYQVVYGIAIKDVDTIEREFTQGHAHDSQLWFHIPNPNSHNTSTTTKWLKTTLQWKKENNLEHSDNFITEKVRTSHSNGLIIRINFTALIISLQ